MCVAKEVVRDPAATQFVLDRLGQLGHRRAGDDERRHGGHRLLDRPDRPSHRLQLLGCLDPAELVHERRARTETIEAKDAAEVQGGLRPDAVADGNRALGAKAPRDPFEHSEAVVRLVHDDDLALWIFAQVEGGEHAREEEDGFALRREEGSRHPAVRIRGLTEVRDLPLDAREVLEVGRRREKEDVDILSFHPRGQPSLPFRVVEHAASLSV